MLGGPHPTGLPEDAIKHADIVLIGEAEITWPQLLKDIESDNTKKFYRSDSRITPERIPPPRREIIKKHFFPIARIQATRGCPYDCDFCAVKNIEGKILRKRPIDNVVSEIKSIPQKFLKFSDASLTTDPEYTKDLFKAMKGLHKKFTCFGNQNVLYEDEELLKHAKKAGCVAWYVGFESINQHTIDRIGKLNNVKDYSETTKKIHKHGIAVSGSFILGFDEDTKESINKTLKQMYKLNLDLAEINILTPFPGTSLYNRLDKEGRIINKTWFNYREGQPGTVVVFQPKNMTPEELQKQSDMFFRNWYLARNSVIRISKSVSFGFYPFIFTSLGPVLFA